MTSRPPSAAVSVPPPAAGAPRQAPPQASGAAPATAPRPDQAALDAVHQAYLASLAELTFNSKPIITNLTIIAHESIHAAPAVARAIEDHLRRADARHVIPAMYLMDSILKNVGGVYRSCFARNIVAVFKAAYAAVPPQDKARLQKLVGTWKTFTTTIFPPPTIAALERLFPQTPGSSSAPAGAAPSPGIPNPLAIGPNGPATLPIQQQIASLLARKRAAVAAHPSDPADAQQIQVLEQLLSVIITTPLDPPTINQVALQIQNMAAAESAAPPAMHAPDAVASAPMIAPSQYGSLQPPLPPHPPLASAMSGQPFGFAPPLSAPPAPPVPSVPPALDPAMLAQLVASSGLPGVPTSALADLARPDAGEALPGMFPGPGMLPPGFQPSAASAAAAAAALLANPLALQSIIEQAGVSYPGVPVSASAAATAAPIVAAPPPRLTQDDLTRFHPSAVFALYEAMPLQCKQCGLRFPKAFDGGSRMDAHLDWHFRQNKRALERGKRTLSRDWYVPEADWIVERDIDVSDKQAVSALFGGEPEASADDDKKGQPVPVLPATEETQRCSVCFEAFEKFFDEEEEIWMIRGAVQSGDQLAHQACLDGVSDTAMAGTQQPAVKRKLSDAVTADDSLLDEKKPRV
ncbi:mRNA 3' end processing factor [Polyrhizophydium stewartii]|uniref:mRNA 3' end processing factor n=1 Tax=Polyrhizophydium stewartii TaxID=2732419 RepID=A0ABR4N2D3_9FUNG